MLGRIERKRKQATIFGNSQELLRDQGLVNLAEGNTENMFYFSTGDSHPRTLS